LLLTSSPRPVILEPMEVRDDEDGLTEKLINKNNPQYMKERDIGPRFAEPGTFEFDFSARWKELYELEKAKRDFLERELHDERLKLEEEMEFLRVDHEVMTLRGRLRLMEEQSQALHREREVRQQEQMRRDDERRKLQQQLILQEQNLLGGGSTSEPQQQPPSADPKLPPPQVAAPPKQPPPMAAGYTQYDQPAGEAAGMKHKMPPTNAGGYVTYNASVPPPVVPVNGSPMSQYKSYSTNSAGDYPQDAKRMRF